MGAARDNDDASGSIPAESCVNGALAAGGPRLRGPTQAPGRSGRLAKDATCTRPATTRATGHAAAMSYMSRATATRPTRARRAARTATGRATPTSRIPATPTDVVFGAEVEALSSAGRAERVVPHVPRHQRAAARRTGPAASTRAAAWPAPTATTSTRPIRKC